MRHGKVKVEGDLTLDTGATADEISTDGTLAGDSDTAIPTEKAVKTYADTKETALGFTPEDVANKDTDNTLSANSDTKYPSQKAIKSYVDSLIQGLDWQESVLDRIDFTTAEPISPSTGDRYINTVTGTSNQTSQAVTIDRIYEWNGSTWTEDTPTEGFASWVEDEDVLYVYGGSAWVKFGSTVTHANLSGLQGGTTNEYYHLTSAEQVELTQWLDNVTLASNGDLTLPNGTNVNEFSTDNTLAGDSDNAVPTEKAVKTYVDTEVAGGGGGDLTLISVTSVSASNSGNIPIANDKQYIVTIDVQDQSAGSELHLRFNSDSTATGYTWLVRETTLLTSPVETLTGDDSDSLIKLTVSPLDTGGDGDIRLKLYINTYAPALGLPFGATVHGGGVGAFTNGRVNTAIEIHGILKQFLTITDFEIFPSSGTMDMDIRVYELAQS